MANKTGNKAAIPNPMLDSLRILVGEWKSVGTHPLVSETKLHGRSSFNWIEGGAFLLWRSEIDREGFPDGTAIFGSDDDAGRYFMLYFDERKVSRRYEVSIQDNILNWWRDAPGFSQRYTWTFADDGNTIIGQGELCQNGKTWEKDLELTYTRIK